MGASPQPHTAGSDHLHLQSRGEREPLGVGSNVTAAHCRASVPPGGWFCSPVSCTLPPSTREDRKEGMSPPTTLGSSHCSPLSLHATRASQTHKAPFPGLELEGKHSPRCRQAPFSTGEQLSPTRATSLSTAPVPTALQPGMSSPGAAKAMAETQQTPTRRSTVGKHSSLYFLPALVCAFRYTYFLPLSPTRKLSLSGGNSSIIPQRMKPTLSQQELHCAAPTRPAKLSSSSRAATAFCWGVLSSGWAVPASSQLCWFAHWPQSNGGGLWVSSTQHPSARGNEWE